MHNADVDFHVACDMLCCYAIISYEPRRRWLGDFPGKSASLKVSHFGRFALLPAGTMESVSR
jgi:hypothetical protein